MPKRIVTERNPAVAHYANYTFNTKECQIKMTFDTSEDTAHYLFPWQNPQNHDHKTVCPYWQWANFGTTTEYDDLRSSYWRYRVEKMYFEVYDVQITKISSSNKTTTAQDVTSFMLQTTEFPMNFYCDRNYTYGKEHKDNKTGLRADILKFQHKGFSKKLPINGKMRFNWKIDKSDKENKWWETIELKTDFNQVHSTDNGYYLTPYWNTTQGLRQKYFLRPIPQTYWGLDIEFIEPGMQIEVSYRYKAGVKVNASVQRKNIVKGTYVTWFPAAKKGRYSFLRDGVEPIYTDDEADDEDSDDTLEL